MFFTLYCLWQHLYWIFHSKYVKFHSKRLNLHCQWMKLCRKCVYYSGSTLRCQERFVRPPVAMVASNINSEHKHTVSFILHHSAVHPQSPGGQLKNTWQPGKRKCPFSCARTNAKTKTGKKYLFTWQKTCLLGRRLVYLAEKSIYSGERRRKRRNNQRAAMVFKECKLTVHNSKCCTKRKLILHFILPCSNFFSFQPSGWPPLHWLLKRNVNCLIL